MIKRTLFVGLLFLAGCGGGDDPKMDAAADAGSDTAQDAGGAADASEAARDAAAE